MNCTVCGHKPSGNVRDECLFELSYYDGMVLRTESLCRCCGFIASNAAGSAIMNLKKRLEDEQCATVTKT